MPTCPNGHDVAESVVFCHECGARVPELERRPMLGGTNVAVYVSIASVVVIVLGLLAIMWVLNDHPVVREASASATPSPTQATAPARIPAGGRVCARAAADQVGVIGTHTSCDFARSVRAAYLAAGGQGQGLNVAATSEITHETYRNLVCSAGRYVVCVGGRADTAKVFFGPFD